MRRPVLAVAAAGLAVLLAAALLVHTSTAFSIGVFSVRPSTPIKKSSTACQKPITVPPGGEFDRVDLEIGTYAKLGPAVDVVVQEVDGPLVRRGRLPAGYPDVAVQARQVVKVGDVPAGKTIAVCVHNRGPGDIALFGNDDGASIQSTGYVDGSAVGFDYDLVFRREPRSFATMLPDLARRATLFRPPWVSPGLYYALIALLLAVPWLLVLVVRSLRSSADSSVQ